MAYKVRALSKTNQDKLKVFNTLLKDAEERRQQATREYYLSKKVSKIPYIGSGFGQVANIISQSSSAKIQKEITSAKKALKVLYAANSKLFCENFDALFVNLEALKFEDIDDLNIADKARGYFEAATLLLLTGESKWTDDLIEKAEQVILTIITPKGGKRSTITPPDVKDYLNFVALINSDLTRYLAEANATVATVISNSSLPKGSKIRALAQDVRTKISQVTEVAKPKSIVSIGLSSADLTAGLEEGPEYVSPKALLGDYTSVSGLDALNEARAEQERSLAAIETARAKKEAEAKAKVEAEIKAIAESAKIASAKAKAEAQAQAKEKAEAQARAKEKAEAREAQAKAKAEAQARRTKKEAEARAKEEAKKAAERARLLARLPRAKEPTRACSASFIHTDLTYAEFWAASMSNPSVSSVKPSRLPIDERVVERARR
jgi:chemotaxis protein histidine kinase CheA